MSAAGEKNRTLFMKGGNFIVFVTTISKKRIWYLYRKVTRAILLVTVSNGNKVTSTVFVCLCNDRDVTEIIFYASVTVAMSPI